MATIHDSYLGFAEESTYGTPVAPTRFIEMVSESLAGDYQRINSEAFRAGQRVLHKDRFAPNPKGAAGDITIEGQDGGLGLLFAHMLGAVSSGAPNNGITEHTFTVGSLAGKSLTVQVGRADNAGNLHPFTYEGGKVTSWEMSNEVDGVLSIQLTMDFAREHVGAGAGAYALASPTYETGRQLFTFVGGSVTVEGTDFAVSSITLRGDNALKTDRWSTVGKREPLEEGNRTYEVELTGEFDGLAHMQRVASGSLASVTLSWASPQGGELIASLPYVRFDTGPVNFDGAQIIEQSLTGTALWDGSTSPVTLVYRSIDEIP